MHKVSQGIGTEDAGDKMQLQVMHCSSSCHHRADADGGPRRLTADKKEYGKQYRKKLLQKINPDVKCNRCGCEDFDCLEINHKEGGGSKEIREYGGSMQLHHAIRRGDRTTDDLELLCRP